MSDIEWEEKDDGWQWYKTQEDRLGWAVAVYPEGSVWKTIIYKFNDDGPFRKINSATKPTEQGAKAEGLRLQGWHNEIIMRNYRRSHPSPSTHDTKEERTP